MNQVLQFKSEQNRNTTIEFQFDLSSFSPKISPKKIQKPLAEWSNRCGSESSILETDVYIWRYALLVVHAVREEKGFW